MVAMLFLFAYVHAILFICVSSSETEKSGNIHSPPSITNNINDINEQINQIKLKNSIEDGRIRTLLHYGCTGSTAAYYTMKEILSAHGFNVKNIQGNAEQDKPLHNKHVSQARINLRASNEKFNKNDLIFEMLKLLNDEAVSDNETLFIKSYYRSASIINELKNDSLFAGIARRNKIDVAICRAKDCFEGPGYSVFATNGTRADDLCFQRREHPDIKLKIKFDPVKLVEFIQEESRLDEQRKKTIEKTLMLPSEIQFFEDLYEFEFTSDDAAFDKSFDAWTYLLKSMVDIDKDILRSILMRMRNTKRSFIPHNESIENFDEVVAALKQADPPYDHFIRS